MTDRPLDKTQQDYVDHGGLVNLLQTIKHGLHNLKVTKTRDGKGGYVVSGLERLEREFYESAFGEDFLKYHERSIDEIQWMREKGMLLSPHPKVSKPERIGGGMDDAVSLSDSIIKKYNAWWKYCENNHRRARYATVLVFGDYHNFSSASRAMREAGMITHRTTIRGLCELGLEIYAQEAKKIALVEK